jgi:hypothetical protein
VRCSATLLLAAASFVLLEQPIRTGRWIRPRLRPAVTVGALAGVAALAAAATIAPPPPEPAPLGVPAALPAATPTPRAGAGPGPSGAPTAPRAAASPPGAVALLSRPGRAPGPPRISFFGDSVARSLGKYFPPIQGAQLGNDALEGCGISPSGPVRDASTVHGPYPKCPRWETYWTAGIRKSRPDVAVVLLGRWEVMDRRLNGRWRTIHDPETQAYLRGQLNRMIALFHARGVHVVLCTSPYSHRHERPDGGLYPEDRPDRMRAWNTLLGEAAATHPGAVTLVDLNKRVCPDGRFTWSADGIRLRSDGLHFTARGVRDWIAPWLAPALVRVLAR